MKHIIIYKECLIIHFHVQWRTHTATDPLEINHNNNSKELLLFFFLYILRGANIDLFFVYFYVKFYFCLLPFDVIIRAGIGIQTLRIDIAVWQIKELTMYAKYYIHFAPRARSSSLWFHLHSIACSFFLSFNLRRSGINQNTWSECYVRGHLFSVFGGWVIFSKCSWLLLQFPKYKINIPQREKLFIELSKSRVVNVWDFDKCGQTGVAVKK